MQKPRSEEVKEGSKHPGGCQHLVISANLLVIKPTHQTMRCYYSLRYEPSHVTTHIVHFCMQQQDIYSSLLTYCTPVITAIQLYILTRPLDVCKVTCVQQPSYVVLQFTINKFYIQLYMYRAMCYAVLRTPP